VWVVLAQHALGVEAAQAPAGPLALSVCFDKQLAADRS
jgi:hypothetical protein